MKHSKSHDHSQKGKPKDADADAIPPTATPSNTPTAADQPAVVPPPAETPANPPPSPQPSEIDLYKDRLLRLQADFENFRKRTTRDRGEMIARANADLLLELLPVVDNLERALELALTLNINDPFVTGVKLVLDQLHAALRKHNVTAFDTVGQLFDVTRHEAVSQTFSPDHVENTIVTQTRRGYFLGDSLLRPAQVVVATRPPEPAAPAEPASKEPIQ